METGTDSAAAPAAAAPPAAVAWKQSLGAGLLLGLALGCGWLARWTPGLLPRLLLIAGAAALAVLGLATMVSLSERRGWLAAWQRKWEMDFAGAGLPFFSALVILALAALTSGNNLLYLIVSGLLGALVVSGLTSALNLSGMELRFRLPEEIFAGQAVPVQFTLINTKGFWPAYGLTVSAASRALAGERQAEMAPVYFAYLPRRQSQSAASTIAFPQRGRYASTAFVLATRFPFGLLQKRRRFQASGQEPETLVYPAPAALPPGVAARLRRAAGELPQSQRGEGPELYRIRAHQAGDSARQVHWKASARAGALRVREFTDESALRVRLRLALPPGLPSERAEAALGECVACLQALARPDLWLEFVGENAAPAPAAPAPAAAAPGLFLPLAPVAQQRQRILEYLAVVDPALPAAPAAALAPELVEIAICG
ncbi:MAG TPA: DUF58 domain-containing protein [Terriglobales bacterium]|nr:DUF58 domain-containing protein [Terriglobales bacterium]